MEENNTLKKEEKKAEKFLFGWIKDNYDKIFLFVLFAAFIIRIFIFFKTMNQPLWWDEADYLSAGKRWGLGLNIQDIWYYRRGFLWPLISALFFRTGISEIGVRFLAVIFSTGIVAVSYLWISEMFNKKLALLTSISLTLSWIYLFFSGRVLTDMPAAFLILLSFMLFWRGYILKKGDKYIYYSLAVFSFAVLMRMQSLMMAPVFLAIVFPKEKYKIFTNKKLWIAFSIFLIILTPQLIFYYSHYGNPASDIATHYLGVGQKAAESGDQRVFSFAIFNYAFDLPYVMTSWMFYLFLIGAVYFFVDLIFGFDKIFENEELHKKFFVLFFLLCLFLIMGYIGSVSYVEQRYLSVGLPFLFLISVYPLVKLEEVLEKNMKFSKLSSSISIVIILLVLLIPSFNLANGMIEDKKTSFSEVEQAGLWIKENSNPSDSIISNSVPQMTYYSERSIYPFDPGFYYGTKLGNKDFLKYSADLNGLLKFIDERRPKYIVLSSFESTPDWVNQYVQNSKGLLVPVRAYKQGDKPVLIIYEFDYGKKA